ncbi:aspartic proteinase CDR1-like [Chenopodium quinoa]|uniref:aspartic proteinase CDR1-like n=1 Tax=Chenopodium quinoa TaxID=63459 RepID=UPI000B77B46F|nr:aspartic proteinase CDR1-like [Chenopodium quinoa]
MHAYNLPNILLILLLASSAILKPPNSISVEARKLATSNGVFKVELIHRDSPLSPYYNSSMTPQERLKRAPLGYISHGHNIQLSSTIYNLNDEKSYALVPNGGGYLMKIALGTPKVEFLAVADTGSDLIWVQCQPCNNCFRQQSPLFNPSKSSTYHEIPCNSPDCTHPDLKSGCASNNYNNNNNNSNESLSSSSSSCLYQCIYGDNTQTTGVLATETLSLPSPDATSPSLSSTSLFGCGMDQQGSVGTQGEGIVGLGTGPSSLISQLGSKINYKFSYCLAPLTSDVSSKLTFGADVTGSEVVSTPFKIGERPTYYLLNLDSISVEGRDNPVQIPVRMDVIIDSGTTLTMLPSNIYIDLRAALVNAIGLSTIPSPIEDYDLCYNTESLGQFSPPNVAFQFQGAEVVLKTINTFRQIEDNVSCLAMLATDGTPIFGNIAQVNFEVGYDLQAKQVSFAPAECTN